MFDAAVIGAGINGVCSAFYLRQAGLRIALIDQEGIAAGGSGAAGAFISPKFTKSGPLKDVIEEAYRFSLHFYRTRFAQHTLCAPLLHIAKYDDDDAKVAAFKASTALPLGTPPETLSALLSPEAKRHEHAYLLESAVVDAQGVCGALAQGVEFFCEKIERLERLDGGWRAGSVSAKRVVLATGAYPKVFESPFVRLRPVWGHRIDAKITPRLDAIVHHQLSISCTRPDGTVGIGATHDVHYRPDGHTPYDTKAGRAELLEKARATLNTGDIEVLRDFTGLRSGANDYMPLIGPLPDGPASLNAHPELAKGVAVPPEALTYAPDLYVINGSGGYGFVLGPYLADLLVRSMTDGTALPPELTPARFFYRDVKKGKLQ